jgi:hypothetical protein
MMLTVLSQRKTNESKVTQKSKAGRCQLCHSFAYCHIKFVFVETPPAPPPLERLVGLQGVLTRACEAASSCFRQTEQIMK